jgi:hypothetical protein
VVACENPANKFVFPQITREIPNEGCAVIAGTAGKPVLISFRTTSSGTNDENERSEVSNSDTAACSSLISLMFDDGGATWSYRPRREDLG